MKKGHDSKSPLLHNRTNPRKLRYSTFDPGASIDSTDSGRLIPKTTSVEDVGERVSISWENIDVFVEMSRPSLFKRLCDGIQKIEKPTKKQVLFGGLRDEFLRFLVCYGIMVLVTNVAVSYGYIISTISPTITVATSLGPPLMLPLLIFGGFFLKNTTVPVYFVWLKYISWFMYGFEALIINQWKDYGPIDCGLPGNTTAMPSVNGSSGSPGGFCVPNGNAAIKFLGFKEDNMLLDIYCLLALIVGFRVLSFLFLLRRAYKEQ